MYLDAAQKSETMKNEQNKAIRLIISTIYFYTKESFWSQLAEHYSRGSPCMF